MIIIYWNCRGIKRKSVKDFLTYAQRTYRPAPILLQETHAMDEQSQRLIRSFGKDWRGISQSATGASGGILLVWFAPVAYVQVLSV